MRNIFQIFIIFTSLLLLNSSASENPRIEAELSAELLSPPLKYAIGEEAYKDVISGGKYRYVGNSKCRLCHRNFFIGRKNDPHDYAMANLLDGDYEENPHCLSCHSTGFGVPTGFVSIEKTPRLSNVQCEACHGPGNIHIKMAKETARKKKEKFVSGGFLTGADNPEKLKKMCIACHTKRWDKAYHDLNKAYDKYKKANPNSKYKSR